MKKGFVVFLALAMLLSTVVVALADTATFTNFVLDNGVNGKKNTASVKKSGADGTAPTVTFVKLTGATQSGPIVVRARRSRDGAAATGLGEYYTLGAHKGKYKSGFGKQNELYYLVMQNTTGGPRITASGSFVP